MPDLRRKRRSKCFSVLFNFRTLHRRIDTSSTMRYFLPFLLYSFVFFSCRQSSQNNVEFYVLQMNDVYEIAPLEGGKAGGLARVATVLDSLKSINPNTISILSGDFISPSLIGTLKYQEEKIAGKHMIESLNVLGLDYVTFGNHEFDVKENEVQGRIDESDFEWIASNTFHVVDETKTAWTRKGEPLPGFVKHTFTNPEGQSINLGLIGITVDFNDQAYVAYDSEYATVAKRTLNEHKSEYDIAFAITHLERYQDSAFALALPEVPLILGGHDHVNMKFPVGQSTVTKADANARTIYIHRCTFDLNSKTLNVESTLLNINDKIVAKAEVSAVVDKWTNISEESMISMGYDPQEVIYRTDIPLDGREKFIRNEPTNLGTAIAQAMCSMRDDLDFAVFNSGSVRLDDQLQGDITQTDILRTLPFGGGVVITKMVGTDVVKMLRIGLMENKGIGGYFQTDRIQLDGTSILINGEGIDLEKTYQFIAPQFLMDGKEANLVFLKNFSYENPKQLDGGVKNDIRDILIYFLSNQ